MNVIQEGREEPSLSGISFPSLNEIYTREEDEIHEEPQNNNKEDVDESPDIQNLPGVPYYVESDDGYPTDEHTIPSLTKPKEKELKRLSILQLARHCLAKKQDNNKQTKDAPKGSSDDCSFLDNANAINVEDAPNDLTFLEKADVQDVAHGSPRVDFDESKGENDADSYYNIHASTLSRASGTASKTSTIGDQILKDSNMAANMTKDHCGQNRLSRNAAADNHSASTYSYRRAFVDHATQGSNFTSTCSALTDDYCFDARKTCMSEPIEKKVAPIQEGGFYGDITRTLSGPADADTGAMLQSSDESHIESLARPPPPSICDQPNDSYENPDHLTRIVSFGGGEGYVDEDAARHFAAHDSKSADGLCGWFTSSSRAVKIVVLFSILLMLISVASVALAFLLPKDRVMNAKSSVVSGGVLATNANDDAIPGSSDDEDEDISRLIDEDTTEVPFSTYMPTVEPSTSLEPQMPPTKAPTISPTKSSAAPSRSHTPTAVLTTLEPQMPPTIFPSGSPAITQTATSSPSKAAQSDIYTTSSITGVPTVKTNETTLPTKRPTQRPTPLPTISPTARPTTSNPTIRPTPIPTEFPIMAPTSNPSSPAPTLAPSSLFSAQGHGLTQTEWTVTLQATQDTFVTEQYSYENYGNSRRLRVDGLPRVWSFLSFDTPSLLKNTAQIQRQYLHEPRKMQSVQIVKAKLRLFTIDEGGGCLAFAIPNAKQWSEMGLTWKSMDLIDTSEQFWVGSKGWMGAFRWHEIELDVPANAFQKWGPESLQNLLIKSAATNGVSFASRERNSGAYSPELVLTFSSDLDTSTDAPISSSSTLPWPTYSPTIFEQTDYPTAKPSVRPTSRPTKLPTLEPSNQPTKSPTLEPTKEPTLKPTRTRAPHKRPKRPTRSPTRKPSPTHFPIHTEAANSPIPWSSMSPSKSEASPVFPDFVPPGCPATADVNLALKQALAPNQSIPSIQVAFPTDDSQVAEDNKPVIIEFELDVATYIVSASLRLFVERAGRASTLSIHNASSDEWGTGKTTTYHLTPSDEGNWIAIDVTDLISAHPYKKIALIMEQTTAGGEVGDFVFSSSQTCHSSKLVVVTDYN